jgi:hypothetical protein
MGVEDILRVSDDVVAGRQNQRFFEQIRRRSFDEPNVTTTSDNMQVASDREAIVIDAEMAPGSDFRSAFVVDPQRPDRVERANIRLGQAEGPYRVDTEQVRQVERRVQDEAGRIAKEVGAGDVRTRVRQNVPGPTETDQGTVLIPHADFKAGVGREPLLSFLDRAPGLITNTVEELLGSL